MSQAVKKQFPSMISIDTDGNTSFLRAARNGQLDKVLEHLKSNIDINTSNTNGLNALHLASKDGHVEIVDELLKRGAIVDSATKKGNTALHIASLAGQEAVVKLLVSHGATVNVQSQNGFTPLYMAAQENHDNVVKYLLANGANQTLSTEDGFTPLAVAMQQGHDKVVTVLLENDTRGKVRLPALHIAAKKDDVKAAKLLLENEHNPDVTSKSGFTPLHIASHYGNEGIANLLVQKGADVNYSAKHNITPLHVAAKWGKTNMVNVLKEHGANIDSKTRDGLTPLHCAARSGHEKVVEMLLERGAPISSKTKNGLAPLHMAAQGDHVDAARILLYYRAPVDEVTVDYLTALHVAAHCGHVRVAKLLLDRQADANARALNGFTPLHIACKKNRIKVVELLLKHGASIGATTESGLTPLHVASFMGCMNIVIYLLQHDANPDVPTVRGETPLHLAARANQTDIIRILLRNGAQVDARAREQQTPLHIASRLGNVDIVMLLLQHGAKVDSITKDMYTALHIASKEGQDEVAASLIDNGASLNATTKKGFTPLHLAAKYGHLKVAKLLLQKEAPVDAQGKNGVTPLHVAAHYDHQSVALLLLEKGASPYATAKNGHTPLHIAAKKNQMDIANTLLEYGAKPNAESKAGFTPLHLSAQEGHSDMSDLLIEHKADTNYKAKNGLAPLHLCAQEDKVPVAEILAKNGAHVDLPTKNGYTPLHIASHYGQINMVRFLLAKGADVKTTTALGYTPLHQAAQQGHTNIVNLLLENAAQPNAVTNAGQTPLQIAQKLGYIIVIDTLKVVTAPTSPASLANDEKYRVVAPEAMQETFMSDSEEEGEDTLLGDQTYRYLTADEMKSLGDDSLPIDVTRDERIDSNKMTCSTENMTPPRHIEDNFSPEHVQPNYIEYIKKFTPDNIDIDRHPIHIGFLVSFLVDARGGAMRGCRHSGVRVIVPPRCAPSPTRITCRYVRPPRNPHPPPLMEGEALASRVLELGPVGAKFLGPVIIEVPHFAALRGKEREIVILRSDNGESWKEHTVEATEEVLNGVLHDSFEAEDLNQLEDVASGRITRIVTQDFPQYFAVVSRVRQEVHAIGPEGGMVSSTVVPQVQAVFPPGALTKKIKVGLQAQPIDPELTAKLLGHGVAVSPVVTVEPRRRKFHKAITLSMPAPTAHSQGMINQYSGSTPTLRLLCSITGGTTRAQWEDVTGSTPLNFVNDCVTFTTTVSARFWLMDCRNVGVATKMATELYREAIHVPFMAKFVVFAKRVDPLEARLRVFCMTDDKEDKTLEHQEHFTEVAKSRDVEVLEGKPQFIEFAGNLIPITKSGEQLEFSFRAFKENRLPFSVKVKDQHAEAVSRCLFMRESKLPKGEPPQQPICILNIVLPDDIVVDTISLTDGDSTKKQMFISDTFDYYRSDPRLADMSNLLGDDWVALASQLGLTSSEINVIKSEYPDSVAKQAQSMLRMWLAQSGNKAQASILEMALRRIEREDIIPQCLNVEYSGHGISKEIGNKRLMMKKNISVEKQLEKEIINADSIEQSKEKRSLNQQINESSEKFDKYSAEEKVVVHESSEEEEEEEDFNKTVTERRSQIEQRLSVDRSVPASSQRVEIVQEITSIKRQSIVENKIAEVEQKVGEIVEDVKTTKPTTTDSSIISKDEDEANRRKADARRDSELLEGVTQRFETAKNIITKISTVEDPKSPKFSKTPPPSPADFIFREQTASIQEWDATKKSPKEDDTQEAKQQGISTTTEQLVASNEELMLDKPLGQPLLTGLSDIDDNVAVDLDTTITKTNAFIQSESQLEYDDNEQTTTKKTISDRKSDDNKNNLNEKKKSKKGFFGSIKTFVEKSFESDSDSEKSPKRNKKIKKVKKGKEVKDAPAILPRKPKLPTPPLEPLDIQSIPYVEALDSDLPPSHKPPDIPQEQVKTLVFDDSKTDQSPILKNDLPKTESPVDSSKKVKCTTIITEEVSKTIAPLVLEAEEFSVIVDPTNQELPKKSTETFTINIDESIEKIEKEILEKSPILSDEKIVKPWADLDFTADIVPMPSPQFRDNIYEDVETPLVSIPSDDIIHSKLRRVSYKEEPEEIVDKITENDVYEKSEKDVSKSKKVGFFNLFKKRNSKELSDGKKHPLSEAVLKDMLDSNKFLDDEIQNYHDVYPSVETLKKLSKKEEESGIKDNELEIAVEETVEEKGTSTRLFGLFKKSVLIDESKQTEESVLEESNESSGLFGLFKKTKKDQPATKLILSEDVATDINSTNVFFKTKKEVYDDNIPPLSTTISILSEKVDNGTKSELQDITNVITNDYETKNIDISEEIDTTKSEIGKETKTTVEDLNQQIILKQEEAPLITSRSRDPSPKPSGFFGLFKKSKKDDVAAEKLIPEAALREISDTHQFVKHEVNMYHDVKPSQFDLVLPMSGSDEEIDLTIAAPEVFNQRETEQISNDLVPNVNKISERLENRINDTTDFLSKEREKYDNVEPDTFSPIKKTVENEVEVLPKSNRGILGIFKKSKDDSNDIAEDVLISESVEKADSQHKKMESSPKSTKGFFSRIKKSKDELSDTEKDEKPNEKLSDKQDIESSPKSSKGLFSRLKKVKTDSFEILPQESKITVQESENKTETVMDTTQTIVHDPKEKQDNVTEITISSSKVIKTEPTESKKIFGVFTKSKEDPDKTISVVPSEFKEDIITSNDFLTQEVKYFNDVKPEKFEKVLIDEHKIEQTAKKSSPKPSKGIFGIFKKSKDESVENTTVFSEESQQNISSTKNFLNEEVVRFEDVKPEKFHEVKIDEQPIINDQITENSSPKPSKGIFGIFKKSKDEFVEDTILPLEIQTDENFSKKDVPDNFDKINIHEDAIKSDQTTEKSTKPYKSLFGILKKTKDESVDGTLISSVESQKDINISKDFLTEEVKSFEDVKPAKFDQIQLDDANKVDQMTEKSLSKPSKGIFGIFKKSKDETLEETPVLSLESQKDIVSSEDMLINEVTHIVEVKPEKFDIVKIDEHAIKNDQTLVKLSPNPSKGIFSMFKKTKDETVEGKPISSVESQNEIIISKDFLTKEVKSFEDVKPEKFDQIQIDEDAIKVDQTTEKCLPKPSKGIFGIFKKSKDESLAETPIFSVESQKDIVSLEDVLPKVEVKAENLDNAKVDEYTIKNDQILEKSSPIPSKSIFGMFKKSKKEDNKDVENNDEHTLKNRQVCNDFLLKEVDVYHDVKPEKFEIIQIKDISEKTEITSKANKSVFGIFKKYKKDETNEPCATDLVLKEMHDSNEFLSKEIENYHDVRPEITLTIPSEEELSTKAAKETSSNFFGIFTKSKKENDDHKVENEVIIDDDPIDKAIVLDVQTTEEIKLIKEEPKTGFLSKFKVSKKRISEEEKSKEINDQIINTTDFIATEVKNYEDGVLETVRPVSNEEFKTADFQSVIKDKLHQSLKSDDQVSLQLKEISENIMITGDASRQVEEIASEYEKEVSPEKDKQSKDKEKKGFFNIFGKKFKSQDGIEDETKEKQEDETLRKKQKQKRRKSSSPFKFFSKKSEDEGTPPKETVSATKLQEAKIAGTIQPVDDLMNVEFKEQIENTLTDEVLSSLDEKLQNLKISYTPAKIKEMHDCRDFLFIEVDNYDHGKSVVVTDIDKDLENQSKANEANISVQLATTTVDDIIEIAKNKVLEDAEILEVQQPNVPENVEIKIKQTSKPGFFSKLGNFISGKIDDTADDISKSKETVITQLDESEKVLTDKIKDTQIKVDTDTKNMKESSSSKAKEIIKSVKNVQEEAYNTLEQQITKVETKVEEVDETIIESLSVEDKMKNIEALQVDNTIRELINNTANKGDVLQKSMDEKLKDIEDKMDDTKKVFAQKTTEAIEHAQLESQQSRDLVAAKITNLTENVTKQKDTIKETVDNFIVKKELEIEQKEKVISKEIQDKRKEITLGIDSIQKDIQDEDLKQLKDVVFEGTIIKTGVADVIIKSDEVVKKVSSDIVKIKESISKNGVEILDNLDTDVRTIENKTEETRNNLVQTIAKSTDDLKIKPTSILNNMVIKDTQQALTSETKHAQHLIEQKATSTKDILIESLSQKIDTIDTGKEKLEFVRSDVKPEEIRADVVSRIQSVEEDKLKLVDNEIEKLTMALGPKSKPDVKISDNIPSYVTSPTFARRTVSQKYSKDERPAAVEVICGKLQDNIEATAYTVTEPDDTPEEGKRKPLFHLESEDDDLNDAKLRQRSDSCKSNVLETLTDKKLNNLLTSLDHSISDLKDTQVEEKITEAFIKAEQELELIKKDSKADVDQIEQKLLDLDKALENLEQTSDSKLERKLHRVERKFERMASEVIDEKDANDETSPTKVEAQREHDFQKLVSQLSTEEVSDFQKEYSHLWDETTFSKSEEWNSKTPDSQADIQDLPQGEETGAGSVATAAHEGFKVEGEEAAGTEGVEHTDTKDVADQHQLSDEMKELLKELERESKQ